MSNELSPRELAAEALAALRATPEQPGQRFQRLIELGWINARGEVTKLLGGEADPEPHADNGQTPVVPTDRTTPSGHSA
jgi:hypothetical protein